MGLSKVMSSRVVAYVEWAGVSEANLSSRAVAFGKNYWNVTKWSACRAAIEFKCNFSK